MKGLFDGQRKCKYDFTRRAKPHHAMCHLVKQIPFEAEVRRGNPRALTISLLKGRVSSAQMTFRWIVWNETISFHIGWESQLFLCMHPGTDPKKTTVEVQQFPDQGSAPVGIPRVLLIVKKYFPELTLVFEETRKGEGSQACRFNKWLKGRRIQRRRKCPGSGLASVKKGEMWAPGSQGEVPEALGEAVSTVQLPEAHRPSNQWRPQTQIHPEWQTLARIVAGNRRTVSCLHNMSKSYLWAH